MDNIAAPIRLLRLQLLVGGRRETPLGERQEHLGRVIHGHDHGVVITSPKPCTYLLNIIEALGGAGSPRSSNLLGVSGAAAGLLLHLLRLVHEGVISRTAHRELLLVVACSSSAIKFLVHFHVLLQSEKVVILLMFLVKVLKTVTV